MNKAKCRWLVILSVTQHEQGLERRRTDMALLFGSRIIDGSKFGHAKACLVDRPIPVHENSPR